MTQPSITISGSDIELLYRLAYEIATEKRGTFHTATLIDNQGRHRTIEDDFEHMQDAAEVMLNILDQYGVPAESAV